MRGTSAASRRSFFSLKGSGDFICSGKLYWPNTLLKPLARPARRTPQRSPSTHDMSRSLLRLAAYRITAKIYKEQ